MGKIHLHPKAACADLHPAKHATLRLQVQEIHWCKYLRQKRERSLKGLRKPPDQAVNLNECRGGKDWKKAVFSSKESSARPLWDLGPKCSLRCQSCLSGMAGGVTAELLAESTPRESTVLVQKGIIDLRTQSLEPLANYSPCSLKSEGRFLIIISKILKI